MFALLLASLFLVLLLALLLRICYLLAFPPPPPAPPQPHLPLQLFPIHPTTVVTCNVIIFALRERGGQKSLSRRLPLGAVIKSG